MKNIILLLICVYFASCSGDSNRTAAELWDDAQKYRTEDKLKESITSFKTILEKYPADNFAAKAQFQIADIYLNDVKDFDFAIEEFEKVIEYYPKHDVAKNSLFMIAYIHNNYLESYTDAIELYNLFMNKYPNDDLIPSVKFELEGLYEMESIIDSMNSIVSQRENRL